MKYLLRVLSAPKALVSLAFCMALAFAIYVPKASAITISDVLNWPKVLGDSTSNPYPYSTASLVNDGGTIYFISGITKVPFTSYKAFTGLGYSPKNVVKGDLSNYTPAQSYKISTANAAHPWGSWLSYNKAIYYSIQDGLIGVPSAEIFLANGGKWNLVVKANKYDIAALKANQSLGVLKDNDPRVASQPNFQFSNPASQNNSANSSLSNTTSVVSYIPQIILPTKVYASTTATFYAVSSDPKLPLTYTFNWGDGSSPNSVSVSHADHFYYTPGSYTLGVLVSDSQRNANLSTTTVAVISLSSLNPSTPQIAFLSSAAVGTSLIVSASSTDPQGLPLTYTFDWGDNSPANSVLTNRAGHFYGAIGTYTITVSVFDSKGYNSSNKTSVTVSAASSLNPSTPQLSLPSSATAGASLAFSASASDPQGLPLSYIFSWGDGSADTAAMVNSATHTYSASGSYLVKVTAIDTQGNTNLNTAYLLVSPQ